jgi:hypothetical protein
MQDGVACPTRHTPHMACPTQLADPAPQKGEPFKS